MFQKFFALLIAGVMLCKTAAAAIAHSQLSLKQKKADPCCLPENRGIVFCYYEQLVKQKRCPMDPNWDECCFPSQRLRAECNYESKLKEGICPEEK